MTTLRLTVPVGTRPEIIKLAPVIAALKQSGHRIRCVATGQHYDAAMYFEIFAGVGLTPDATWQLSGSEGERLGQLLASAFHDLATQPADAVLVLGDTYTAPLFAMAARRFGAVVATGVCPTPLAARSGVLLTAHRATNVDSPERVQELVRLIRALGARYPTVLLPLHPRTRDRLERAGWLDEVRSAPGVRVCAPLPYTELLTALSASQIVVTDSGGLQEEAAFFGVPVVVMRHSTPRWEGVAEGSTLLTGLHCARVLAAVERLTEQAELTRVASLPCPYGDGTTARQVCGALAEPVVRQLLSPREPPFDPARPLPHLPRLKQARGPTTGPPARSEPSPSTSTTRCSRSPPGCREPGRQWRTSARGSAWIVLPSTPLSWRSRPKAATAARSSTGPCPAQVVARYTARPGGGLHGARTDAPDPLPGGGAR